MTKGIAKQEGFRPEVKDKTRPSLKLHENEHGALQIEIDDDYARICHAGTGKAVVTGIIGQIASLGSQGTRVDEGAANFGIGFVDSMAPKDAAEALLFTQMAAIHQATMTMARRLNHVDNIRQQDAAERALNKLARTYTAQMDTLKRYRSKGQTVRVERVTVESGGQAIVGNVTKGGRMMKSDGYPMHCAPRCTAKSKRTGQPCKSPAVRGWTVCRMHGAHGGARSGTANPNWKHGQASAMARAERKTLSALMRECRQTQI